MCIEELNKVYEPIYTHMKGVLNLLKQGGYHFDWGYFGQHYVKLNNEWVLEYYPIPVITIKDICDVGFDINHTFIEFKLKREHAMKFDFSKLHLYKFEVYGINDFLIDFYNKNLDVSLISDRIKNSEEQEIGISLFFKYNENHNILMDAIEILKKENY